jgi:hypothetical protein
MQIQKGDLVTIRSCNTATHNALERHGYLWIVDGMVRRHTNNQSGIWTLKSVATGELLHFYDDEIITGVTDNVRT